ncbi:MAG: hypothetical protein WAV28_15055 [Sedimentisphaerales bacterium]|jgi:hypothetical protein
MNKDRSQVFFIGQKKMNRCHFIKVIGLCAAAMSALDGLFSAGGRK